MNINQDITSLELEAFRNLREEVKVNNQLQKKKSKNSNILCKTI